MDFIDVQRVTFTDIGEKYGKLGELFEARLWHQLTDHLEQFVKDPECNRGDNLIQLYEQFITRFDSRINQLRLVIIVAEIAKQYYPSRPFVSGELERALALLDAVKEKRARLGEDAYVVAVVEAAAIRLTLATAEDDAAGKEAALDAVKAEIDSAEGILKTLAIPEPVVAATFHRVSGDYHKIRGPAEAFYGEAMQYMAHCPIDTLSEEEKQTLAIDVALAAIVGKGVFNFGEIMAHPIMSALSGTPHEWLRDLLRVFHTGDIDAFNSIVAANRSAYDDQPALSSLDHIVKEKVALVCVMELASQRPASDRSIPFRDIASATRLPIDQVEWLLMRAMSLGLVRGVIDELDQVVHISFIKPRVMDMEQIAALKDRLVGWGDKVKEMLYRVEDGTREMFA